MFLIDVKLPNKDRAAPDQFMMDDIDFQSNSGSINSSTDNKIRNKNIQHMSILKMKYCMK